ncbi:MAG: hypothetical protein ROO73_05185 [Roseivirga sp.]
MGCITLDQIREVASDALAVKEKIEEINRLRRDAIRLGKRLQRTNYLRLLMSVGEGLLKVELNPGRYVPHTEYTRGFKEEVHMDLSSERGVLQQSGRLLRQTRKGLSLEQRSVRCERTLASYGEAVENARAHDRALARHIAEQRLSLARYYEALAEGLLKANEELKELLEEEGASMSTAEAVQAYQTLSENTQKAAELKGKAYALLSEASSLSAEDKEALLEEAQRLAARELLTREIAWYEGEE